MDTFAMRSALKISILLFLFPVLGLAQNPSRWSLTSDANGHSIPGGTFKAKLKADIEDGWHLYALEQPPGGPIATTIAVTDGAVFKIDGKIESPKPTVRVDPLFTGFDGKALETRF